MPFVVCFEGRSSGREREGSIAREAALCLLLRQVTRFSGVLRQNENALWKRCIRICTIRGRLSVIISFIQFTHPGAQG